MVLSGAVLAGGRPWRVIRRSIQRVPWILRFLVVVGILVGAIRYWKREDAADMLDGLPPQVMGPMEYRVDPRITGDRSIAFSGLVLHVTKEYGDASMGGLGTVLTSLTTAQALAGNRVGVVLPGYTYILDRHAPLTQLTMLELVIRSNSFTNLYTRVAVPVYHVRHNNLIDLYLIGAGDVAPFSYAFHVTDKFSIYDSDPRLEWFDRDAFFSAAVANFVVWLHADSLISCVHIHGATNALAAHLIRERHTSIGIVYTLHDYLDETTYKIPFSTVKRFAPSLLASVPADAAMSIRGGDVFLTAFGLHAAHVATCVSRSMAAAIVSHSLRFKNRMLVADALMSFAKVGRFVGISNGLDVDALSPFDTPDADGGGDGGNGAHSDGVHVRHPHEGGSAPVRSGAQLARFGASFDRAVLERPGGVAHLASAKQAAKRALISMGVLPSSALSSHLILFVGRFQVNKGVAQCGHLLDMIDARGGGAIVALMGQPSNYPMEKVNEMQRRGAVVLSTLSQQADYGALLRAAADIVFVPSLTEAFGLVAAEGLLFGSIVLSSGVGGLRDFLIDRPPGLSAEQRVALFEGVNTAPFNAFFYSVESTEELAAATMEALAFLDAADKRGSRDLIASRCVQHALGLQWDRPGGPLSLYSGVYRMASDLANAEYREAKAAAKQRLALEMERARMQEE